MTSALTSWIDKCPNLFGYDVALYRKSFDELQSSSSSGLHRRGSLRGGGIVVEEVLEPEPEAVGISVLSANINIKKAINRKKIIKITFIDILYLKNEHK